MSNWAAIEQALIQVKAHLEDYDADYENANKLAEALAAVGEAKRRESELERERDDLQRKIDGYFLSSEFAWWVEKAEKAEARVAELERGATRRRAEEADPLTWETQIDDAAAQDENFG